MAVSVMTGCGASDKKAETAPEKTVAAEVSAPAEEAKTLEEKKKPVTINIWHASADDKEEESFAWYINKWAEKYMEKYPHVTVKITPNQSRDKMLTAISSGTGPDIFQNLWQNCATWSDKGALYDLTDLVNNDPNFDKDDFVKGAWERGVYKNKVYGIPFDIFSSEIFYNKDLLAEAGYSGPPETIEELVEMAIKLTKYDKNGDIIQAGYVPDLPWLDNVLWPVAFGAKWIDPVTNKITFDSPEMAAAYQWQVDIYDKLGRDKLMKFRTGLSKLSGAQDPFMTGKIAIMFNGEWTFENIKRYKPDLNYGVAPIPYPKDHPELKGSMFITTSVWSINANTKVDIKEVWNCLADLTSKQHYKELTKGVQGAGKMYSRKSSLQAFPETADPLFKEVAVMLQSPNTDGFPMLAYVNEYLTAIGDEMTLALNGKQTVAEAQRKVVEKIQPLADKFPINK